MVERPAGQGRAVFGLARRRATWDLVVAVAALATGAALVVHILGGISLPAGVLAAGVTISIAFLGASGMLPAAARSRLLRRAAVGAIAGLAATAAYDASRFAFVSLVPVTIWPFEAIRLFGQLLVGADADPRLVLAAGIGYHIANGTLFGVAFGVLVQRPTIPKALAWAGILELLMVSLYPGWLVIRAFDEFAAVSIVGHASYGTTLGVLTGRWLRPTPERAASLPAATGP